MLMQPMDCLFCIRPPLWCMQLLKASLHMHTRALAPRSVFLHIEQCDSCSTNDATEAHALIMAIGANYSFADVKCASIHLCQQ